MALTPEDLHRIAARTLAHYDRHAHVSAAGFAELTHFYRPTHAPIEQQRWLASVWRKPTG